MMKIKFERGKNTAGEWYRFDRLFVRMGRTPNDNYRVEVVTPFNFSESGYKIWTGKRKPFLNSIELLAVLLVPFLLLTLMEAILAVISYTYVYVFHYWYERFRWGMDRFEYLETWIWMVVSLFGVWKLIELVISIF